MGINERITLIIDALKVSVSEFERVCGLSNGAVSKMGANTRVKTFERITKAYPYISMVYLQTGEGPMFLEHDTPAAISPSERINKIVEHLGISINEIAEQCGYERAQVIYDVQKGKTRNISEDMCERITKTYPEISRSWLRTGEGFMIEGVRPTEQQTPEPTEVLDKCLYVPLIPLSARAGRLDDFTQPILRNDCEQIISPIKGADMAITVTGDSMEPEYPSGSKILIKRINEKAFIEWGKVYVLDTCNGIVIKKVMPSTEQNTIKCMSLNPDYPPFEIHMEDIYNMFVVVLMMAEK